jgi:hypothetical protein
MVVGSFVNCKPNGADDRENPEGGFRRKINCEGFSCQPKNAVQWFLHVFIA